MPFYRGRYREDSLTGRVEQGGSFFRALLFFLMPMKISGPEEHWHGKRQNETKVTRIQREQYGANKCGV